MKFKESKTFKGSPEQYIKTPWNPTKEPKPTVMDKAEELKRNAKIYSSRVAELTGVNANLYVFTEGQLDEYAQQVSREAFKEGHNFAVECEKLGASGNIEIAFDVWQQKQK